MKLLGFEITRTRSTTKATSAGMLSVPSQRGGWWRILEPFTGAWQQNRELCVQDLYSYPTLYACIMRRASDIGKMPFCLKMKDSNGIWAETQNPAYSPVLRKPNGWQTAQQFREAWIISKVTQGNTYVLKRRDERNVVVELYVLDPCRVQPKVTASGDIYYQLNVDPLQSLPLDYPAQNLLVPASEIIHDRCMPVHHPLVGLPPLAAAYWPVVKNLRILQSSAEFFANNANPGGILTAPAGMSDDDAQRVREYWATAYSGANAGKVAVIGADMKFTSFAFKSVDAQLVEQMQYSDRQICQPFGIPPYIVGVGEIPAGLKVDDVMNTYFSLGLQSDMEAMEDLLEIGLGIPATSNLGIWMDTEPLLRMDMSKQTEVESALVAGKIKTPDEARRRFNLAPTGGGDTLWGQDQDKPLGVLADPAYINAANAPAPAQTPPPDPNADAATRELHEYIAKMKSDLDTRAAIDAARAEAFQ